MPFELLQAALQIRGEAAGHTARLPFLQCSPHSAAAFCCSLLLLLLLQEEYPEVFRFSCPVIPSEDDHVVTSPYNATLAASVLVSGAHCVLPLENQALAAISSRLEAAACKGKRAAPTGAYDILTLWTCIMNREGRGCTQSRVGCTQ
jgi:hypothetical protein